MGVRLPPEWVSEIAGMHRSSARGLIRTFGTPAPPNNREIDFVEHPTAAAARANVSPPLIRSCSSDRSASVSRFPWRIPDPPHHELGSFQFAGSVAMTA